ncbi:uncharacterized protein A4U43_C03F14970 [Asparagus officinalis]|uniref:Uncharacterized protein n=1 Tax=Asparagus officinalis TaxID=4686 RepID=A0A5P1FA61_ASPOF|nr:uncharacterized protein At4g38062 [Asparagus officinalis]ONK75255.1 uncharacterized protein A4U43_C03F14970 [Asparagus officinalis]
MEQVYKELEEARTTVESLTEEIRAKSALFESLRRAHAEQSARLQESRAQIEKQAKEIDAKGEEISVTKLMCEELRSKVSEKESAFKHLSLAHENLKAGFSEKVSRLEGDNKQLVSALDEANMKGEEQGGLISSCEQEIEKLKGLLSITRKKCADAEQRAQASREARRRDETISKMERDKEELENQLKWKTEQFRHLEDAHNKAQEKFRACKKELEMERANLIDEVSSLQTNLDSKTRVAEDLRSKLEMCNQVLAREESRRKLLEIQMAESKAMYENVMSDYEEARSRIRSLTVERDEEIAALRNSLATKGTLAKELEYRATHLEQENEELRSSLKELQEAQVNGVGAAASLKTLQQKFRALEQAHRSCSEKMKARDAEWSLETEKLNNELDDCLLKLSDKDEHTRYLQAELEVAHSSLMQQKLENEEIYVVLMILKSKFVESSSSLEDLMHEYGQNGVKAEERIRFLMEQLEKKSSDLAQAQAQIKREHETVDSLLSKMEYSESIEQEYNRMKKEISSYKVMLEESSQKLEKFKKQTVSKEDDLMEDVRKALSALDQANCALAEKSNQLCKVEYELKQCKLVVEQMEKLRCELQVELNECRDEMISMRRDLEHSLVAKVKADKDLEERKESFLQALKQKDMIIEELQESLLLLEEDKQDMETKLESKKSSEYEKEIFFQFMEDMDRRQRSVQTEIDSLEQNYVLREFEFLMKIEEEKLRSQQVMEEKEKVITDMQNKILSCERDADIELCVLSETLEKIMAVHILNQHEIYFRHSLVAELEKEIDALQRMAKCGEDLAFSLKNCVHELEAKLAVLLLEKKKEQVHFEDELKVIMSSKLALEARAKELESEKEALYESIVQVSSDRDELVNQMMGFGDLIVDVLGESEEVKRKWDRVTQNAANENAISADFQVDANFRNPDGKNFNSPSKNKTGQVPGVRSPLKEHNKYFCNQNRVGDVL